MGCCLTKHEPTKDQELSTATNAAVTCKCGPVGEAVVFSHDSASNSYEVRGNGTALGSCALDCDCARWEVAIEEKSSSASVLVGVKRYNKKSPTDLSTSLDSCQQDSISPSWILNGVDVNPGDVIGVYWDQTDLPMLSFTLNGNLVHQASINRIRPSNDVYPAVSISGNAKCRLVFDETSFKYPSIASKFKMIICSQSII
jgi:hypothetical protein